MATYVPNQLYQVPLAELQPDPAQPRDGPYLDPFSCSQPDGTGADVGSDDEITIFK